MNALKHCNARIKQPILQLNKEVWMFLHGHVGVGVAGGEGVVVGEDHVFGAVGAEGGFVVAADDGEGVEDVGGVMRGRGRRGGSRGRRGGRAGGGVFLGSR